MHQRELSLQRHLVTQIATAILASAGLCAYAAGDPLPKSGSASIHSAWSIAGQFKDLGGETFSFDRSVLGSQF